MRNSATTGRRVLVVIMAMLGLCGALLLTQAAPAAAATRPGTDKLVLSWVEGGKQLQVSGFAYRPKAVVDIRLGSEPIQQARSDANGQVRVSVPQTLVAAGQSGASIIVTGRSVSGASRVLISAVPPQATGRGPIDFLPWALAALAVAVLASGAVHRLLARRAPRVAKVARRDL
ncbi:hypothetical protein, partial [Actinoplanes sp. NPDC026623]|uniref:hypothetical protein n=1 Tax=Actinoplanes sp. NPDC026623 TaxID=3155610 RepID=UPI0034031796